jgi:exonuclease-1
VSRVQLLRSFNITPVLVFDGGALPSKKGQEEKRRKYFSPPPAILPTACEFVGCVRDIAHMRVHCSNRKRREERAKAAEYLQQGNRTAANDCYRKAVDITPRMAHKLIKVRSV